MCILLAGSVEVMAHKEGKRIPKTVGVFEVGDILGFKEGDNGITSNVETWTQCMSDVEAIWMDEADFASLWKKQQKY